jgi:hypothetical protein
VTSASCPVAPCSLVIHWQTVWNQVGMNLYTSCPAGYLCMGGIAKDLEIEINSRGGFNKTNKQTPWSESASELY